MVHQSLRNSAGKPKRQSRRAGGAKGIKMPKGRIDNILKYEKSSNLHRYLLKLPDLNDEELADMRSILERLRFRKSDVGENATKFWTDRVGNFSSAVQLAIEPENSI